MVRSPIAGGNTVIRATSPRQDPKNALNKRVRRADARGFGSVSSGAFSSGKDSVFEDIGRLEQLSESETQYRGVSVAHTSTRSLSIPSPPYDDSNMEALGGWWSRRTAWERVLFFVAVLWIVGSILFVSTRGDSVDSSIYTVSASADGEPTFVTNGSSPAWSRVSNLIALTARSKDGSASIYVIDMSTSEVQFITNGDQPSWSPDGTRIAFSSPNEEGSSSLYVIDLGSGDVEFITDGRKPSWSPDGTRLVFASGEEPSRPGIYSVDLTTSDVTFLTDGDSPSLSPDGGVVALVGTDEAGTKGIYTLTLDTLEVRFLMNGDNPAWSPDGSSIAFTGNIDGEPAIYVSKEDAFAVSIATGSEPTWSPDGGSIAFVENG